MEERPLASGDNSPYLNLMNPAVWWVVSPLQASVISSGQWEQSQCLPQTIAAGVHNPHRKHWDWAQTLVHSELMANPPYFLKNIYFY